jgi:hypothetical protein
MSFTVSGQLDDGREASVSWHEDGLARRDARSDRRGLLGDALLIERALRDELDGRTCRATPTGPFFRADLDDSGAALAQLTSYFRPRYTLDGEPPEIPVLPEPVGAVQ